MSKFTLAEIELLKELASKSATLMADAKIADEGNLEQVLIATYKESLHKWCSITQELCDFILSKQQLED